ncbi:MAG: serine/threonine-protein phosphatase, partial [Candidatus Viridilinea halotolerans]
MSSSQPTLTFGPLLVGACTDTGMVREENEDAYGLPTVDPAFWQSHGYLFAVADGVGGGGGGSEASQLTITTLYNQFYSDGEPDLLQAIKHANMAVRRQRLMGSEAHTRMASTVVMLLFQGTSFQVAHVGDSRAYLVRNATLYQLTLDHSLVQEQLDAGAISAAEAQSHQRKNVITRAIGADSAVDADVSHADQVFSGDTFILCSDGLTNHVDEPTLVHMVTHYAPMDAALALLQLANQN